MILRAAAVTLALLLLSATARATDWEVSLDTRLVNSDADRPFMDGGLGTVRFGRTNQGGGWSVDVPRGRYHVAIWHPRLRDSAADLERELTVGDTDRADLTLRLAKPLEPAPITGRPHSWDY
jgi:hypothetical protein